MSTTPRVKFPYRWVDPQTTYPDNRDIFVIIKVYSEEHYTQILSAGTEGAYLMYPDEHHQVSVPLLEAMIMSCDEIAQCLLANEEFMQGVVSYLLSSPTFTNGVNSGVNENLLEAGFNQNSEDSITKDTEVKTSDKDALWGACKEVVELLMDYVKTLCFFMQAVGDITDLVNQMYSADKRKRIKLNDAEIDGSPVELSADGELVNTAGEWEFIPNALGTLVQTVSESTMIAFLTTIAELGANLILADMTDTRAEALSCVLFNLMTCDGETPLPSPYTFDDTVIYNYGEELLFNLDGGLVGEAISACLIVTGVINGFVTLIPLSDIHRNFRIGLRSPNSEWEEICTTCQESWEFTFDFEISDNDFGTRTADMSTRENGVGWISSGAVAVTTKEAGCKRDNVPIGGDALVSAVTIYYDTEQVKGTWTWNITVGANSFNIPSTIGESEYTVTGNWGGDLDISAFLHFQSSAPNDTCRIRAIKLSGVGINPFV